VVFVLYSFYWAGQHWLYVPVTLLAGWFLAAKLLLPTARVKEVAKAARSRAANKTGQDPADPGGDVPAKIAFGLTAGDSAWADGKRGARYGLILGAPWSLLYLWELAGGPGSLPDDMLLGLLGNAVWLLLEWGLYGFFFGYFYPYLRGDNGIQKGAFLFLAIVVPPLLHEGMTELPSDWPAFGLWALQALLFSLTLGIVAGDLDKLWRAGQGWTHLKDLPSHRYVRVLGSALVLA
jgi:hypothetical protein